MTFTCTYSDINANTPQKNDLLLDLDSVGQSILNILSTNFGERLFLPEFGASIENILFELADDTTQLVAMTRIIQAIERWDTRVLIDYNASNIESNPDNNSFELTLVYRVRGLESEKFEMRGVFYRE